MGRILKFVILFSTILLAYKIHQLFKIPPLPKYESTWWGPRNPANEDTSIKPFKINVSDEVINDLNWRLTQARPLVPSLKGVQHQYGFNTHLLNQIVEFWLTKYNWREREKYLNQYPQFTVSVQGLRLHYIHVKPTDAKGLTVLPLLMLHGWPESVTAFYEMIPLLTKPQPGKNIVFEVIVASLPGFGFSEAAVRPGLGGIQMAVVFKNFMERLGFDKYYLHGIDWGSIITQHMATLYPDKFLGLHVTMCFSNTVLSNLKLWLGSFYPSLIVEKEHEHKVYPLTDKYLDILLESGYLHLQATKPDTVGVGLNDSPVGLLAYILEKFIAFTNPILKDTEDGGLDKKFTYTNLLDNVMIYWTTNSITTSMRLYAESFTIDQFSQGMQLIPIQVPSACARFPYEVIYQPTSLLQEKFPNLVHVSDFEDGGHFAASEYPKLLVEDIYSAFQKILDVSFSTGENKPNA